MYNFIKGVVDEILIDGVSLENNGIGYFISVPKRTIFELKENEEIKIFTVLVHREDAMKLFGFKSKEEREIFKLLNSVSGVGSKTALGVLSEFTAFEIITAIYANDSKKLSKASGIGAKTAQRIILELKEKITSFKSSDSIIPSASDNLKTEQIQETESALFALGYSKNEIEKAIVYVMQTYPDFIDVDDFIRESLIWLSNT